MIQDVNTYIIDLPTSIRSFVRQNDDMTVTIIINARLSAEERSIAFMHEIEHIKNDDLHSDKSADTIEAYAHHI